MKDITQTLKDKYYRFEPGEFLPIYSGYELLNKGDFHRYRIRKIIGNPGAALHYFTHYAG